MFNTPGKNMFRTPKPFTIQQRRTNGFDYANSAHAAFSLARLRSEYSGACVRVRRSSDNAEQDIGFVDNVLDTSSLLSFVGAGSGFVAKWYDQSGNSVDVAQTTTTLQPRLVNAGAIDSADGTIGILFTASSFQRLDSISSAGLAPTPVCAGIKGRCSTLGGASQRGVVADRNPTNNGFRIIVTGNALQFFGAGNVVSPQAITLTTWQAWEFHALSAADSSYTAIDGVESGLITGSNVLVGSPTLLRIGMHGHTNTDGRFNFDGYLRTVIVKKSALSPSDKTTLRAALAL